MSFTLQSNLPNLTRQVEKRARVLVHDTAAGISQHIKLSMVEPKSGRHYKVSKTGRDHVASAPGESPAIDTGLLANSIDYAMTGETSAVVGSGAEYAIHLEFGTVRIAPRPFMQPAFESAVSEFEKGLKELLT